VTVKQHYEFREISIPLTDLTFSHPQFLPEYNPKWKLPKTRRHYRMPAPVTPISVLSAAITTSSQPIPSQQVMYHTAPVTSISVLSVAITTSSRVVQVPWTAVRSGTGALNSCQEWYRCPGQLSGVVQVPWIAVRSGAGALDSCQEWCRCPG